VYQVVNSGCEGEHEMISNLLKGMKTIFQISGEHPESMCLANFPGLRDVERLVEPMKQLADMIHIGFMTGIYEVRVERPGVANDSSRMEAWNSDIVQPGTAKVVTVACTLELGLCKRTTQILLLVKPLVLLQ